MHLTAWDLVIVVTYLAFVMAVGIVSLRRSNSSTVAFFAADRNLPGWLLGISMVATTFAVDTPLAVTGIVAKDGIAGNWFWWCTAIAHVGVIVLFGRLWRRSEVITDAELVELRYGGRPARVLRSVQATFYAVGVNCIVLGWGLTAADKLVRAVLPGWPPWWTVTALVGFALVYSTLGGLRAVVITDLAQFAFAMVGSVALALFALRAVGGLDALVEGLQNTEGVPSGALDMIPRLGAGGAGSAVVTAFATYLLVQWWARMHSDGGGYLAQRMIAARDPEQARTAATWFVWLHYVVRPWPWIIVALAALVLYPPGAGLLPGGDREMAYPVMLVDLLPAGLLGLALAALLAAFMSTVDTHLNWGTSYLVNDLYGRLIRPAAGRRELMIAAWAGMALMACAALGAARMMDTVEGAWKFLAAAGAGLGLPTILRWLWWRMTAWAEMAGMAVGASTAALCYLVWPEMEHAQRLWIVTAASLTASAAAVTFGPRTAPEVLQRFVDKVQPPGYWGPYGSHGGRMVVLAGAWALGVIGVFGVLIGMGQLLLGPRPAGAALAVAGALCWLGCRALMHRADRE